MQAPAPRATEHFPAKISPKDRKGNRFFDRDHFVLRIIAAEPGCTIQAIANKLGCAHATASSRLAGLARDGAIVRERDGRVVRHFLPPSQSDLDLVRMHQLISESRMQRIIGFLLHDPNGFFTPNEISMSLGIYYGGIRRDLGRLAARGLITFETRPSNRFRVRVTAKLSALTPPTPSCTSSTGLPSDVHATGLSTPPQRLTAD